VRPARRPVNGSTGVWGSNADDIIVLLGESKMEL